MEDGKCDVLVGCSFLTSLQYHIDFKIMVNLHGLTTLSFMFGKILFFNPFMRME